MIDVVLKVAAKAVVIRGDKVLILREASTYDEGSQLGKYGLPGGRMDDNEAFEDALRREVKEETGLTVSSVGLPFYVGEWSPEIKGVAHHIVAIFVVCHVDSGDVELSSEHDTYHWISTDEIDGYTFMQPDDDVLKRYAVLAEKGFFDVQE